MTNKISGMYSSEDNTLQSISREKTLLNDLSQAKRLVRDFTIGWAHLRFNNFQESYLKTHLKKLGEELKQNWLTEILSQNKVIEIWPWGNPFNLHFECREYIWVQPFESLVPDIWAENYEIQDWLSYLKKQEDNSAIIVCIWVIDQDILNTFIDEKHRNYARSLLRQIERVSKRFYIIIWNEFMEFSNGNEEFITKIECSFSSDKILWWIMKV